MFRSLLVLVYFILRSEICGLVCKKKRWGGVLLLDINTMEGIRGGRNWNQIQSNVLTYEGDKKYFVTCFMYLINRVLNRLSLVKRLKVLLQVKQIYRISFY